jgi:hypothetical protein
MLPSQYSAVVTSIGRAIVKGKDSSICSALTIIEGTKFKAQEPNTTTTIYIRTTNPFSVAPMLSKQHVTPDFGEVPVVLILAGGRKR